MYWLTAWLVVLAGRDGSSTSGDGAPGSPAAGQRGYRTTARGTRRGRRTRHGVRIDGGKTTPSVSIRSGMTGTTTEKQRYAARRPSCFLSSPLLTSGDNSIAASHGRLCPRRRT